MLFLQLRGHVSSPTSVLEDVPALVDEVSALRVPLADARGLVAAPLEAKSSTLVTGGAKQEPPERR